MISAATNDSNPIGQGVDQRRLELLRGYVRSAIRMARLLLDEVLDVRFENEAPEEYRELVGKAAGDTEDPARPGDVFTEDQRLRIRPH